VRERRRVWKARYRDNNRLQHLQLRGFDLGRYLILPRHLLNNLTTARISITDGTSPELALVETLRGRLRCLLIASLWNPVRSIHPARIAPSRQQMCRSHFACRLAGNLQASRPLSTTSGCTIVKQSFVGPRFQRSLPQLTLSFLSYSHWTDRRESIDTDLIPSAE
jgi:hypothetical protein